MSLKLLGRRSVYKSRPHPGVQLVQQHRLSSSSPSPSPSPSPNATQSPPPAPQNEEPEPESKSESESESESALTRRFTAMAEDALTASPRRAPQIASENTFPSDLKRTLEARIAAAALATATATVNLPAYAPKHTRDIASAQPWTGAESPSDSVLRMLVDAHKPLKHDLRGSSSAKPANIDLLLLRPARRHQPRSSGDRIARARDKTAEYSLVKDAATEADKAEIREQFRERFQPGAPAAAAVASVNALGSLADERIEEARQRGAFRHNSMRGKPLVRDHAAESPFLDTTEYLLNRIIKDQDIVPPWIEKQQELAGAARTFRERLRVEWKRHVSRTIAAEVTGLEEQCRRAERYAEAEERLGRLEERAARIGEGKQVVEEEETPATSGSTAPFRDPVWERTEASYHNLSIENLNSITRTYNLMAPELAKKTYFSLERELKNCFRECAPQIAGEIRARATRSSASTSAFSMERKGESGILESLAGESAAVYDSKKPNYGFKEFWRDVFGRRKEAV
ncbi:uncharacterized protein H6S33_010312 [Morchella sextelata]|uniref:uncharacterized protein n=1 Tax=Morchella sextelata TaxID=1174677 RepID=UPI001D048E89|nr:uncharacterized protein H6S33_010312 [Morchella sextelata]KAH0612260.1 hypothetical protein H6S33_010312 [Morchella sextelata]